MFNECKAQIEVNKAARPIQGLPLDFVVLYLGGCAPTCVHELRNMKYRQV